MRGAYAERKRSYDEPRRPAVRVQGPAVCRERPAGSASVVNSFSFHGGTAASMAPTPQLLPPHAGHEHAPQVCMCFLRSAFYICHCVPWMHLHLSHCSLYGTLRAFMHVHLCQQDEGPKVEGPRVMCACGLPCAKHEAKTERNAGRCAAEQPPRMLAEHHNVCCMDVVLHMPIMTYL